MTQLLVSKGIFPREYLRDTVDYIASQQEPDGAIPWFEGGVVDPWNHVEAAMGLSIGGRHTEAARAYEWMVRMQLENGSWMASYRRGQVEDGTRAETNFVAYVVTGVWIHYLITRDDGFLADVWPMLHRAMTFVTRLQTDHGEIYWALDTRTGIDRDALITGCCSIFKSLECMANIADALDEDCSPWLRARERLGHALRHKPERFDRTWESKDRYSMDWFYPVLTGVLHGRAAEERLNARWEDFVVSSLGCRCVVHEPWITVAESCELTMALLAVGDQSNAARLFSWLHDYRRSDGSWWTGYVYPDSAIWPEECPTWTAGAVLLAADALAGYSAASNVFTEVSLPESTQHSEGLHYR